MVKVNFGIQLVKNAGDASLELTVTLMMLSLVLSVQVGQTLDRMEAVALTNVEPVSNIFSSNKVNTIISPVPAIMLPITSIHSEIKLS